MSIGENAAQEDPDDAPSGATPPLLPDSESSSVQEQAEPTLETEPEDAEQIIGELRAYMERYSGPLPHPSILEHYRAVDPGAADWILRAASNEQEHRHWCEKEPLRQSARAQWFAFTIAVLVILVGGFLIYRDKPIAGLATILVPLATILGVFIYREVQARKEATDTSAE